MHCAIPAGARDLLGCAVLLSVRGASHDIWIDHDAFYDCGDKCITLWSFASDAPGQSGSMQAPDRIMISNNLFHDSYYAVLIGVDAHVPQARLPTYQRVTFYGNFFRNVRRRSPRAASGSWAHVFNNLVVGWGGAGPCRGNDYGFGSSANAGAELVAEANVYAAREGAGACPEAIELSEKVSPIGDPRGFGLVRARDNVLLNGATVRENNPERVFDPKDRSKPAAYYDYSMLPAREVRAYVLAHAGPEKAC